ncbi:alpha/beta hydrolase [Myceligenerans pegani]|uniref:Alpha/beta hydrolase n=1 Tax=Myceligenerans pegani TaxID=2776917 RepID=A0ABR9N698_9MICO|nr:alpha/beta hydrolase [Myceligenerans sp. TRM 65318]MBE1878557.1 alpha/beta hydrolase [Myceligenerans sp. TRM 65318]MBE3020828.1 alpha/beta hydrolase [Myceligenerans sp. TRM 65318]
MTTPAPGAPTSAFHLRGGTPFFASQYDPRLHYSLYVPRSLRDTAAPLVVVQHGTGRTAVSYRDALRTFADANDAVILTPMFPAGLIDPDDLHNFKFIEYRGIRFDHALLSIVDEVAERFPVSAERFYLHGFSGGGQFAHRFYYLHPDRLAGVSIGAPGRITELDDTLPWWLGTAGMEEIFQTRIDHDALRRVPVHMVVGADDTETWEINNPGESNWMDGVEKTGTTRIERLRTLERSLTAQGIQVTFDLVPDVGHRGVLVLPAVESFFADLIRRHRPTTRTDPSPTPEENPR